MSYIYRVYTLKVTKQDRKSNSVHVLHICNNLKWIFISYIHVHYQVVLKKLLAIVCYQHREGRKKTNSYLYIADMLEYKSDLGGNICTLKSLSDW